MEVTGSNPVGSTKMSSAKKRVAIFDVDGTIFRSSLFIELVEAMIEEGYFPADMRDDYALAYRRWLDRKGSYDKYLEAMIRSFMKNLKGVRYADFAEVAKTVVSLKNDQVYRYTRNLLKELKKKGFFLLAVSQSPKKVLDLFCKRLGFDKVYGRLYELGPQNRFTGAIIDLHLIANKANILKRAVEKENLTLRDSIAVGDSEGDIPMLEMVDRPICFNPNMALYRYAKLQGWKIVVERKDVIYEIKR